MSSGKRADAYPAEIGIAKLNDLLKMLTGQGWWASLKPADQSRKSFTRTMIGELRSPILREELSAEFVDRIFSELRDPEITRERSVIGLSIGYKQPGRGKLGWVDVAGVTDPAEAGRLAAASEPGRRFLAAGYREYGCTPMIEWRKKFKQSKAEAMTPRETTEPEAGDIHAFRPG